MGRLNTAVDTVPQAQAGHAAVRSVSILGSSGSIGQSTLAIVAAHPRRYKVFALSAHRNVALLESQCLQFEPRYAVLGDASAAAKLQLRLRQAGVATEVLSGASGLEYIASHTDVDTVMAAIVGAAGLASSLAAARAGKKILLANKESLVVAGALFMRAVRDAGASLLPVDSEHNAIFQCLDHAAAQQAGEQGAGSLRDRGVAKILLTGSGGPFRQLPLHEFADITPEQACAHPNWDMGKKISVDSATMMNKGLEFIEACWLFDCAPGDIEILVHPQSVVHSMVEYIDGSVLAQLGVPDMRTPIAHALAWPERIESHVQRLDWHSMAALTFAAPDLQRFPALRLAQAVAQTPGTAAAVLNAANEVAVQAFLDQRIGFTDIVRIAENVVEQVPAAEPESLAHIQAVDQQARQLAEQWVSGARRV